MAVYINKPSVEILNQTSNSVTYRCTISMGSSSYYGYCSTAKRCVIKKANGFFEYIGWPIRSKWKSSWHAYPDSKLENNQNWNGPEGNLPCTLIDRGYTWEETVYIDRGTSRSKSQEITVGVKTTDTDSRFPTSYTTFTVSTSSIPEGVINYFNITVDDKNNTGTRYIRIYCEFTNPESYHTCRLTDNYGNVLKTSSGTSLSHNIPITQDMYQTNKVYTVTLYGKDNRACSGAKTQTVYIEPSGVGVTVKPNNDTIAPSKQIEFKNVNFKEAKEVWVVQDGSWHKTKK